MQLDLLAVKADVHAVQFDLVSTKADLQTEIHATKVELQAENRATKDQFVAWLIASQAVVVAAVGTVVGVLVVVLH